MSFHTFCTWFKPELQNFYLFDRVQLVDMIYNSDINFKDVINGGYIHYFSLIEIDDYLNQYEAYLQSTGHTLPKLLVKKRAGEWLEDDDAF